MGRGLSIKRARYGDDLYKQSLELRREILAEPFDLEFDERFYGDDESAVLLACVTWEWEAVSTAMLVKVDDETVKMRQVATAADMRGLGFASRLVAYLEGFARARGYRMIQVPAQKTAETFYRKLGYRSDPDGEYEEVGIPHVMMHKAI